MTHQAKRPYAGSQPSIASYFSSSSPPNYSISSPSTTPPLPPNIQSNLLSVGMRVRKSVPEGYKTGTYSAFQLFSDPGTAAPVHSDPPTIAQRPKTRPRAGARELTPFCGILKVGGMAQQQWGIYNSSSTSAVEEDMDDEDMPFLSSQGSTVSDVSVVDTPNGHKRRFSEDEEEVENGIGGGGRALGERVLAVPRRKRWTGKVPDVVRIVGQENLGFAGGQDVDFEEAPFLDYGLVGENVEMSG